MFLLISYRFLDFLFLRLYFLCLSTSPVILWTSYTPHVSCNLLFLQLLKRKKGLIKGYEQGPFRLVAEDGKSKCSWVSLEDISNIIVRGNHFWLQLVFSLFILVVFVPSFCIKLFNIQFPVFRFSNFLVLHIEFGCWDSIGILFDVSDGTISYFPFENVLLKVMNLMNQ